MSNRYPLSMRHPHWKQSVPKAESGTDPNSGRGFVDYSGKADQFAPVVVNNQTQEAEHRAKGYVAHDEAFPAPSDYVEFPKWMKHETHEPVLVNNREQQDEAEAKGYFEPGKPDANAVEAERASPYVPGRHAQEYPRMENGVMVDDPALPAAGPLEYPKALTPPDGDREKQVIVATRAEENAQLAKWGIVSQKHSDVGRSESDLQSVPTTSSGVAQKPKKSSEERSAAMKAAWAKRKAEKAQASA